MNKKFTLSGFLIIIILIFTACSGEGIFYTIQNEELISDSDLPNIKFMDVHNSKFSLTGGYYIARGRKLWYRSKVLNSGWKKIELPSGADAIQSSAMYNGNFYYTVKTGDSAALYRVDSVATTKPSTGTKVFTISPSSGNYVVLKLFADEEITSGNVSNDLLFMNTIEYDEDTFNPVSSTLSYQTGGTVSVVGDLISCTAGTATLGSYPIQDMAFGAGRVYLIFNDDSADYTGGALFESNDNFVVASTEISITDGWYEAVYAVNEATEMVMVSANTDSTEYYLMYNNDFAGVGTWKSLATDAYLSCFAWADDMESNYIVAGTKIDPDSASYADGIYLINTATSTFVVSADSGTLGADSYYSSSDLETSSIYSIIVDDFADTGTNKAVLTAASKDTSDGGVWFMNGSTRIWNHE